MVLLRFFFFTAERREKKSSAAFGPAVWISGKDDPSKKIEKWFKAINFAYRARILEQPAARAILLAPARRLIRDEVSATLYDTRARSFARRKSATNVHPRIRVYSLRHKFSVIKDEFFIVYNVYLLIYLYVYTYINIKNIFSLHLFRTL